MSPRLISATPNVATPNVVTAERAIEEGVSARSLRDVAKWNFKYAKRERGAARDRLNGQGEALTETANKLEAANDNRRRA